jgi:alpha-amylase/alpha-mannosidase (GH57 family)
MSKIYLAILWHHHQPYYRDTVTNTFILPWVRLHGIKDYYGMAALLKEFPRIKININLVPGLLKQIKEYESGKSTDRSLELAKKPAENLDERDKHFILDNFFMAHPEHMIGTMPRYKELWSKVHQRGKGIEYWVKELSAADFRDLQVLANLVWFHSLAVESDGVLQQLRAKGKDYTEQDKQFIINKQYELLGQIIPLHKSLQEQGQVELTTTPFYHPILPLLCNMESARVALPNVELPILKSDELLADAQWQVNEAVKLYTECFGRPPRGIWPAEGSVSPEILTLLAEQGIKWFASDEEILAHSLKTSFSRDKYGHLLNPEPLYQPYKVKDAQGRELAVLFRNQHLSNLIGFQYQRWHAEEAAKDLIGQIKYNMPKAKDKPFLVSIILDGENPWEHYPGNGLPFLRSLYRSLSEDKDIETVCVSDFLHSFPAGQTLPKLYSGSWISHNFAIWIGHEEDRKGWQHLLETRRFLKTVSDHPQRFPDITEDQLKQAWESIYIAEGSDWFWWFGPEHSSSLDTQFDALFRKYLMNVYQILGQRIPDVLYRPIKSIEKFEIYSSPFAFSVIKIDGKRTDYFEWIAAGHYAVARDKTVMDHSGKRLVRDIYFGFDELNAYFRVDTEGPFRQNWSEEYTLQLHFLKPQEQRVILTNILSDRPLFDIYDKDGQKLYQEVNSIACGDIIELACPFSLLGVKPYEIVEFFVDICQGNNLIERYPATIPLRFQVPSKSFETINWQA